MSKTKLFKYIDIRCLYSILFSSKKFFEFIEHYLKVKKKVVNSVLNLRKIKFVMRLW